MCCIEGEDARSALRFTGKEGRMGMVSQRRFERMIGSARPEVRPSQRNTRPRWLDEAMFHSMRAKASVKDRAAIRVKFDRRKSGIWTRKFSVSVELRRFLKGKMSW